MIENAIIIVATGVVTFITGLLTDSIKEKKKKIADENSSKDYIIDELLMVKNILSETNTVWMNTKNFLPNKISHMSDPAYRSDAMRLHISNLGNRFLRSDINILLDKIFRLSTEELNQVFTINQPQSNSEPERHLSEYMNKIGDLEKEVTATIEKIEKSKRKHILSREKY